MKILNTKSKFLKILVTGGAGFVGSHLANRLICMGHHVSVIDNLSSGFKESLLPGVQFFNTDLCDFKQSEFVFQQLGQIDVIYHFASLINVKESCEHPKMYFENNMSSLATILELGHKYLCHRLVFASSGSVYGSQTVLEPFHENVVLNPMSPYSESKVRGEELLKLFKGHSQFKALILRFSNVAGSALNLSNGQRTAQPYHVFHRAGITQISPSEHHQIFGTDYATADGTAVRDFIHVEDLVNISIRSLNYLLEDTSPKIAILNAGANYSLSVLEIFQTTNTMFKNQYQDKKILFTSRRLGDPAYLVSDSSKIMELLKWTPDWTNKINIATSTVRWLEKLRNI